MIEYLLNYHIQKEQPDFLLTLLRFSPVEHQKACSVIYYYADKM